MIRILGIASLVLAVVSTVSAHVVRHRRSPPGWQTNVLESYELYHERYLDQGCDDKHDTPYFNNCCHPLLKGESLDVLYQRGCNLNCDDGSSSVPPMASHSPAAVSPSPDQHTTTSSPPVHTTPAPVNPAPKFVQHIPDEPSSTPAKASPTPSPTNAGSGDSGSGWIFGGHGTYFYQYGRPGACGTVHQDTDFIVAMDTAQYSASICGKTVEISYQGNTVQAKVADECPTCVNGNSIDMSLATFKVLADVSVGDLVIKWRWV